MQNKIEKEWRKENQLLKECYQIIAEAECHHVLPAHFCTPLPDVRRKRKIKKIEIPKRRYL